jgi:hypothetical protein
MSLGKKMFPIGYMGAYPFDFDSLMGWQHIMTLRSEEAKNLILENVQPLDKAKKACKDVVDGNKNYVVISHLHKTVSAIYKHDFTIYLIAYEAEEE